MLHISTDKDLSKLNTFRMRVKAARYVTYDNPADLLDIPWDELPHPILNMGAGSNLLFTGDFSGTVLHCNVRGIEVLTERCSGDDVFVRVGAGEVMDEFCAYAARKGWWGTENLSGIPGSVGAAPVQNVGAYGVEACDAVDNVECFDTAAATFTAIKAVDCAFAYRDSIFKHQRGRYIVHHVTFRLTTLLSPRLDYGHLAEEVQRNIDLMPATADPYNPVYGRGCPPMPLTPMLVRDTVKALRDTKLPDPDKIGSAGSFFKNPVVDGAVFDRVVNVVAAAKGPDAKVPRFENPDGSIKIPAAFLIDFCGFKGERSGGAQVWPSQPLVLVNATGNAAPEDIIALENRIIDKVKSVFGIVLSPEVDHIVSL